MTKNTKEPREPYQLETRMADHFAAEHGLGGKARDALARLLAQYGDERMNDGKAQMAVTVARRKAGRS